METNEKKAFLEELQKAPEIYVIMSVCTKMPYVYCEPESYDDQVFLFHKEEDAKKAEQTVVDDLAAENAKFGYRDCLSKDALKNSEAAEHSPLLLTLGLIAGTMSGFFGVGGGIIVTPSLCLFTKMAGKKIMGTSLVRVRAERYV